jgi:hypothetical protein
MHACMYRWQAPRADAPWSVDVQHVCILDKEHHLQHVPHLCSCRAEQA